MLVKWSLCDGPPWDQLLHFTLAGSVGLHYRAMLSQNNTIFPSLCLSLWEWSMYFYFSEVLTLLTTVTECHSPAAFWSTWWRKKKTRKIFLAQNNFFFLLFEQARKHCVWVGANVQSQWGCEVELSEIVTMLAKLSTLAWLSASKSFNFLSLILPSINNGRLDSTRSLHGCKRYKSHVCGSCERKIRNQNRVKSEKFFLPTRPNIIIFSPSSASYDDVWTFHLSNRATESSFGAEFSAQFHLSLLFVWAYMWSMKVLRKMCWNFSND